MDCSLTGTSVQVLQAKILEWVHFKGTFPSPGYLPDPGMESGSPALQADALPSELLGKPTNDLLISRKEMWNCHR